ncbi:MAG: L-seryl-tRNA(Sec) selenium transferase [Anaerolineae bacterium UTCFX2]|jgi:L-seryl-tRNA(Ser) seleniumtransferase|nr:L-seryl-tRNA(Sec) selenium transferase [Anaerolineales bacterium]OQY90966.1 MAG: L-seryl-tRNA(Sec) selenium transferase [Anaerolineae bacterium UTCFX2]
MTGSLRDLPSVDSLLQSPRLLEWIAIYGRLLTTQAVREALAQVRAAHPAASTLPARSELEQEIHNLLTAWTASTLEPVINATGVILHTNLGRAPLSRAALAAAVRVSSGYSNLEYDLERGQRGSRLIHAEALLQCLTGAEAALVVNNNAAAVLLVLTGLARRRAVVIARSQLVEIGGGFRVPDVMKQSGARLLEIGATNRVHLADYAEALREAPALVLRAHRSNFRIIGFTGEPALPEIVALAHQSGVPVVDDLGSGSLIDTARFGLAHEPTVQESLAAGADLVCFSGDKLLGGPQAGIIIGRGELVAKLKKHPLARAIRADKLCLASLTATLGHYLKDEAEREIPIWRMISTPLADLEQRAQAWRRSLGHGEVVSGESTVGGGSLPGETLPSWLLALSPSAPDRFLRRLRQADPPVIARLKNDQVVLDPRTVLPEQEQDLLAALRPLLG